MKAEYRVVSCRSGTFPCGVPVGTGTLLPLSSWQWEGKHWEDTGDDEMRTRGSTARLSSFSSSQRFPTTKKTPRAD